MPCLSRRIKLDIWLTHQSSQKTHNGQIYTNIYIKLQKMAPEYLQKMKDTHISSLLLFLSPDSSPKVSQSEQQFSLNLNRDLRSLYTTFYVHVFHCPPEEIAYNRSLQSKRTTDQLID